MMLLAGDDDQETTTRGLEYMTVSGFDITASSLDAVKIILEEQKRQRDAGEPYNAELFACAVGGISRHRGRIAHLAGMKDARGVYGDGNFKTDRPAPKTSNSFNGTTRREPRRGQLRHSESGGTMLERMEQARRLRGSRGPRERRHRSCQGQEIATEVILQQARASAPSHMAALTAAASASAS
jgi:hypothetical protein